jgi:CRISPR-associated protein Csm1
VEEGAPKTLNMLAFKSRVFDREASQLRGKAMLGAFKADVDNLGLIFGLGLKDKLSISRFSFLSRMFNHFFADYVVSHIQEQFPDIYVVFAGGDDVFFLGPWNQVADMASFIAQHFRTYVADNPKITLSAGITVHKPGEPIHTIADLAEKELEKSKRRRVKGQEVKNGVTLFGVTTGWERFEQLLDKGRWIEGLILENKMTLGLARRLMSYTDAHRRFMDGHIKAGMYKSHMEYDFSRNVYDHLRDKAESDSISANLRSEDALQDLRLPLSWALYHLRSE